MPDNNTTSNNNSLESESVTTANSDSDSTLNKIDNKKSGLSINLLQITGIFFTTLLFISLAAGYFLWQFVDNSKINIEQNISSNSSDVSVLSNSVSNTERKLQNQIKALETLQIDLSNSVQALLSKSTHMRKDWLISEAEYLVKLAINRLALEGDVNTAITALSNADSRLLESGDPGLLLLREELSNSITALKAIPLLDISGISIQLSSIIQQIELLPLDTPDPVNLKSKIQSEQQQQNQDSSLDIKQDTNQEIRQDTAQDKSSWSWQQVTSKVVTDLTSLIRIRQHDQAVQPLLPPEQRFFLIQNLKLQLEQARTALLYQRDASFHERLNTAIKWTEQHFDKTDPATKSTLTILTDLNSILLTPETPDLSYALVMFRDFQAGIRLKRKPDPAIEKKLKPKFKAKLKPKTKPKLNNSKQADNKTKTNIAIRKALPIQPKTLPNNKITDKQTSKSKTTSKITSKANPDSDSEKTPKPIKPVAPILAPVLPGVSQ